MFIYNVTINIEKEVEQDWLKWMKDHHIPDVMKTGCFTKNQLLKVWGPEDLGPTYSVQYMFKEMVDIENYQNNFAKALQAQHNAKFAEKFTAFRTVLQIM